MHVRSVATLGRPKKVVIGCIVALCTWIPVSAQTAASDNLANAASSSASQRSTQNVCDRGNAASGGSANASNGTISAPTVREQSSQSPDPVEARKLAEQHVTDELGVWKRNLKLNDWQISYSMTRLSDLKPNTLGQIRWDKSKKSAAISVMDPCDYRLPFHAMLDDMELTIIHELVHLKLSSLPRSEASRSSEEQAVNGISEALFELEHEIQSPSRIATSPSPPSH